MKVGFLRRLYEDGAAMGGHVSVYTDTSRDHENAAEEVGLRWRAARQSLADAGADEATLDAAGAAVTDPAATAPGTAVFARHGAVTLAAPLRDRPRREIARLAALPHVMPMLAQMPPLAPHLLVAAARGGGEIVTVTGTERLGAVSVAGPAWRTHKTSVGGWAQDHYQHGVEDAWEQNAQELAAAVTEAAKRTHAEVIVIGGDVRARSLVAGHLPQSLQALTVFVDREVAAGSGPMAEAAEHAAASQAERESRDRFSQWQVARERSRGVEGLAATLAALRDGGVAGLFLADRPSSTATLWIGPGGADLAVSPDELAERGVSDPVRDRADAAIARALAFTDAELHFLPEDLIVPGEQGSIAFPQDGICALLRWPANG